MHKTRSRSLVSFAPIRAVASGASSTPSPSGGRPVFAHPYRLLEPLGHGATSTVWRALDQASGLTVAIKVLREDVVGTTETAQRFEREVRILGRLEGASGVKLLASGIHAGSHYAVMEHLHGRSLSYLLTSFGPLDVSVVARILGGLFEALEAVHAAGIVHRDVKPANIMVTGSLHTPRVALVDFGLASSIHEPWITAQGLTVGTALYMSPEQAFSPDPTDHGTDLWAAAVVAYQCLTGQAPFEGATFALVCVSLHRGLFPDATTLRGGLSPALDAFFDVAFASDLKRRFPNARAMASAFAAALQDSRAPSVLARARANARASIEMFAFEHAS